MSVVSPEAPSCAPALVRRRSGWSFADQAVSSSASFAIGLLVSREAALSEVGAFAVAFGFYQLLIAVGRPLNSDPLTIKFSAANAADQQVPAAVATGGAVLLGILVAPVGVLVGLVVGGATGWALAACALFAPVFLLQDAWRYVFFTQARPAYALASDTVVLISVVPLALLFQRVIGDTGGAFVAVWGAAAGAGAIACLVYRRLWPRVGAAIGWWRRTANLGRHMLGENLLAMGSYLAALSIVAAAAGGDELGRLRVAQVAFAPATFLALGLGTIMLAEGSRRAASESRGVWRLAAVAGTAAAGAATALAVLWSALPTDAGAQILGPAWAAAHPLVLPVALHFGAIGLTIVLSTALRSLSATGEAFRCRAFAAPATVAAALAGSLLEGPGLAILGMGMVEACCAAVMLQRLRRLRTQ